VRLNGLVVIVGEFQIVFPAHCVVVGDVSKQVLFDSFELSVTTTELAVELKQDEFSSFVS
jgi:hypothetical protein